MKGIIIFALAVGLALLNVPVRACTGLVVDDGERVLVGNNEDWFNPRTKIWFIQPVNKRYGIVFFGFDNFGAQGGMNQKGLFFDAFALKPQEVDGPDTKPRFKGDLLKEVMATCATVTEALAFIEPYSRSFMTHFQLFLADASGDAVIVEANEVIRKAGRHQVVTNFRQSETDPGRTSCQRYRIARDMLTRCPEDTLDCVRRILSATHQEGDFPTLYSNIYDLKGRRVHVYHFHNFQEAFVIDLEKELANQTGVLELPSLFAPNFAAQTFSARYTDLKKEFVYADPRFVVRYPDVYEDDKPLDESQVFLAKSRYGQVPVLTISVTPAAADMALSQVGGEFYAPRLRQVGEQVRILSNRPARLMDGSEAYETRIAWRWEGRTKINSLVLSAIRDNRLINVALHHTGELAYLQHIPYSLRFGPRDE
ncbi:MAG: carcinine hydrolase/isopenicillin-N N-acyltransferase family protein [Desulfobacterales bacterium]|nr:carcinine hydrolase/isopenicillin-N N-acyltransferase family protein [Desulfobacterales bacterium]